MVQEWNNADNLYLKYGPDKALPKRAGEARMVGDIHEVTCKITLTDLTETETVMDDTAVIPKGARIQEVELLTQTLATLGTAIDVGLARRVTAGATTLTEIDYDGLLAAAPIAVINAAGERTIYTAVTTVPASATGTGALIGTTLANNGLISASRTDSTAFGAGVVIIKIRYFMP